MSFNKWRGIDILEALKLELNNEPDGLNIDGLKIIIKEIEDLRSAIQKEVSDTERSRYVLTNKEYLNSLHNWAVKNEKAIQAAIPLIEEYQEECDSHEDSLACETWLKEYKCPQSI